MSVGAPGPAGETQYEVNVGKRKFFGLGNREITVKVTLPNGNIEKLKITGARDFEQRLLKFLPRGVAESRKEAKQIRERLQHAYSNLGTELSKTESQKLKKEYQLIDRTFKYLAFFDPNTGTKKADRYEYRQVSDDPKTYQITDRDTGKTLETDDMKSVVAFVQRTGSLTDGQHTNLHKFIKSI